ncbi:alpha/beta fold hydrolase [Microbispora sp. NPDC046933]|uniref:alpha/beta fold hydrolase n=1 Tax=Microbispora sp. NPDC046933 TaxID=3155618 RepID=UPI0033FB3929
MRHTVTIAGRAVEYDAQWESLTLTGADGTPDALISATAYLAGDPSARPVMFLFNGGPGASSSPLHMSAFGPRRFVTDPVDPLSFGRDHASGRRRVVPNPFCLLDAADLVFIDPVGTGFSRELRQDGAAPYLSVHGDAAATERFIRWWLAEHKRQDSPIYLVGESFGGFRLATMCARITDLDVAGLVFISPMLDASATAPAPGNDLPHVFDLPTMAVAAWVHGRASAGIPDAATVFASAQAFAQSEYLTALHLGSGLPQRDRAAVAERVADLIALPAERVLADDLRVQSETFLRMLLADRGELVGRLDTRITGPMPPEAVDDRPPAADDPALGIGRSNVIHSDALAHYLRSEAEATDDGSYVSLSLELNFAFDWRNDHPKPDFYRNPTANISTLLRERPHARALLIGGYFDLATPLAASVFAIRHCGAPPSRVETLQLTAGHSLADDDTLRTASAALRALIRTTSTGT